MKIVKKMIDELKPGQKMPTTEDDLRSIKESLEAHGIIQPIVVKDNVIIDGNTRFEIAKELGIPAIDTVELPEDQDPKLVALRLNAARRHYTPEQKMKVLDTIAELEKTRKLTIKEKATLLGVGERTAKKIAVVQKRDPVLLDEVKEGKISINQAYAEVKMPNHEKPPITIAETPVAASSENSKREFYRILNETRQILLGPEKGAITEERHAEIVIRFLDTFAFITEYITDNINLFTDIDRKKIDKKLEKAFSAISEYKKRQALKVQERIWGE